MPAEPTSTYHYWGIPERKKAIPKAEWHIKVFLDVDGTEIECGQLRYSDAALTKDPREFARNITSYIESQAAKNMPKKKGRTRK